MQHHSPPSKVPNEPFLVVPFYDLLSVDATAIKQFTYLHTYRTVYMETFLSSGKSNTIHALHNNLQLTILGPALPKITEKLWNKCIHLNIASNN